MEHPLRKSLHVSAFILLLLVILEAPPPHAASEVFTGEARKDTIVPPPQLRLPPEVVPQKPAPAPVPPKSRLVVTPKPPRPTPGTPVSPPVEPASPRQGAVSTLRLAAWREGDYRSTWAEWLLAPETYLRKNLRYDEPVIDPFHVTGPTEISLDPLVIGTNILLAILFFLTIGTSNFLFNNMIEAHGDELHRRIHQIPLLRAIDHLYHRWSTWNWIRKEMILLCLLILYAIIGAHINTSFDLLRGHNIGMLLVTGGAITIAAYANDVSRHLVALRWKCKAFYKPHFLGLIAAISCVSVSRMINVAPGYLFGIPMSLFIITEGTRRNPGMLEFFGILWMLLFAIATWSLLPILSAYEILSDFNTLLYVLLVEALFFLLLPFGYLPGSLVFAWKKWVWATLFGLTVFLLLYTLFNPNSTLMGIIRNPPARNTILLLGVFATASFSAWGWMIWKWKMQPAFDEA